MSNLSLSLNIDTRTTGSESLKKLSGLIDELGEEAQHTHGEAKQLGTRINELEQQKGAIASFRSLKKELGETTTKLQQAQVNADKLGKEFNSADKPTKALSKSFNDAKKKLTALKTAEQQQTQSLQTMRGQLEQSGIKTNQLNNAQKQLAIQLRATDQWAEMLSNELEHQKRTLDKTATSTEKLTTQNKKTNQSFKEVTTGGKGFNGQLNKITTGLVAAGAAYVGINTVTSSIKDLLATGGKFEKLDAQMRGIMGSIEAGEQATEWVKDFAKNTPLQLDGVTKAFIKAKAYGLDPMDGTLQALTDSVSKLGGGQEELEGVVLAVGQAWSKQKLQAEEVNQLVERGIPVWDLLGKALGKTTAELQDMSSAGQIGRKEIKLLMDEMATSSAGSAKAMMTTWDGIVSNLYDNLDKVKNTIAKSGLLDTFKEELSGISTAIDEMAADGSLQTYAKEISDAIVGTLKTLKNGLVTVYEWREEIAALAVIITGLKLNSMFVGFASASSTATTSIGAYRAAVITTTASAKLLGKATKLMFGPVGVAVAAAASIYEVGNAYRDMKTAQDGASEADERQKNQTRLLTETFKKYSQQVGMTITSVEQWEALQKSGDIRWNETAKRYEKVNKALEKKIALEIHNSKVMAESLLPITEQLNTKYRELVQSGSSASDAIAEIATSLDATSPQSITDVVEVISHLKTSAQVTSADIEAGLRKQLQNLSHDDLATLASTSTTTFNSLGIDLQSIITAVDPLNKEFEKLGLKLSEVSNASTDTASVAISAFDAISTSAGVSSTVIQTAFKAALNKVSTQADLNELSTSWENYAKSAKLSADELALGLLETKVKAQDLTGAYDLLGITSAEKLALTAERHKQAYEQIKIHSTNVGEHKLAVKAWAEAELEAASAQGKTIGQAVLQEAALLGVTLKIGEYSTALDRNALRAEAAKKGSDLLSLSYQEQEKEINKLSTALERNAARAALAAEQRAQAEEDAASRIVVAKESIVEAAVRKRNATDEASGAVSQLNNGRLNDLRSEIGSASVAMHDLRSQSEQALDALNDELMQLQGRGDELASNADKARLDSLTQQIETYREMHMTGVAGAAKELEALEEQRRVLQQINAEKEKKRQESKKEKVQQETSDEQPNAQIQHLEATNYALKQELHLAKQQAGTKEMLTPPSTQTVVVKLQVGNWQGETPTTPAGKDDLLYALRQSQLTT